MARKKNEKIVLENVELKPQVLGYTFQKKNNMGRVLIIFIAFILVVYFIDDISVFFNNLLGRQTAETISNNANNNNNNNNNNDSNTNNQENPIEYYTYSDNLQIKLAGLTFDGFSVINKILTFDVNNLTSETIDVADKNIFLETYDENKTLIDRFKLDINSVANNSKISLELNVKDEFNYVVITEKSVENYPSITLNADENGESTLVCTNAKETITYTFKEASLIKINHKIVDNDINDVNYNSNLNSYQNKVNNYKQITGVETSITNDLTGYNVDITLDLEKVDSSKINDKYYYAYKEAAKVINYEMPTYGFTCK